MEALGQLGWNVFLGSPADEATQIGVTKQGRAVWQKGDGLPFIVLYNARNEPSCHEVEEMEFTRTKATTSPTKSK